MRSKLVLAAVFAVLALSGCGGGAASPSEVASAAGATSCDNSGFYVQSTLTGKKDVVYDCRFANKLPKCVTYSGNIASDSTQEISAVFASSLNSRKPPCLAWRTVAVHQRQVKRQVLAGNEFMHSGYAAWWGHVGAGGFPNIYWKWTQFNRAYDDGAVNCSHPNARRPYGCMAIQIITVNGCPTGLSGSLGVFNSGRTHIIETDNGSTGPVAPHSPKLLVFDQRSNRAFFGKLGRGGVRITSLTCQ